MSKRALITGLSGFTGRYLAATLSASGYTVFGIDAHAPVSDDDRRFQVNLLDKNGLKRVIGKIQPNVVAHLAAVASVGHGCADDFYSVNVVGTRNLLESLSSEAGNLTCVLLASSANVYGNSQVAVLSEKTMPCPANDYAVSKLAMEYMARLWMGHLPIVVTRPFNYTGVGQSQDFLVPKIVDHFRRRAPNIELGNVNIARDFSDVRFVARVYAKLLELAPVGEIFNVCSGVAYELADVLATMKKISGQEMKIDVNPSFVRNNEVLRLQGDDQKLRGVIGLVDPIPLEETLAWMYFYP